VAAEKKIRGVEWRFSEEQRRKKEEGCEAVDGYAYVSAASGKRRWEESRGASPMILYLFVKSSRKIDFGRLRRRRRRRGGEGRRRRRRRDKGRTVRSVRLVF